MAELCLMASHGCPTGFVFHSELESSRVYKWLLQDCQPFWRSPGSRHEMKRLDSLNVRPCQIEESWKPISGLSEATQFLKVNSTVRRPLPIDVQEAHPNSMLFSYGIAEQCTRHEKIMQFLMSGSDEVEGGGLGLSMLSDLTGHQALTINMHQRAFVPDYGSCSHGAEAQPSLIYPISEFCSQGPLLELAGDLARRSEIMFHPDDRVSCTGVSTELKDMVSVVAEYYMSKNSTIWRKQSVIPYFNRLGCSEARANIHESTLILERVKFAPQKSPEKIKPRPSQKKKANKKTRGRDLYSKNYFHACESLLSIMTDKGRNGKTAMLSLKKSGPELPQLLTQFSASIAGTGLAVLFSVICKVASSRIPFCASKLFSTGIGFGLFWLSGAVNRLRDTVVYISKNSGKLDLKEEEMTSKLDICVKEVFFRAAALMVVAVLRLA